TEDLIPLEEDWTLPIKFRIEKGIVADQCDPASDDCCDVDGNTCDDCDDAGSCAMIRGCPGGLTGLYDPNSGLCWQDPPSDTAMNWYVAAGVEDATHNPNNVDYCGDLVVGDDWRLPTISELRSVFRKGSYLQCTGPEWDMSWEYPPQGICGIYDDCLSLLTCWDMAKCKPDVCSAYGGPGGGGCYWDAALIGECAEYVYWSASENADDTGLAWYVYYLDGRVRVNSKTANGSVRCVRSGPRRRVPGCPQGARRCRAPF
ncbi:MAG: DUF1566 domain-containing protein, partial [Proteobacteria bacterium]|nr:DUF1566 domain-containing protein [Pseudomonadota bacterium]